MIPTAAVSSRGLCMLPSSVWANRYPLPAAAAGGSAAYCCNPY